MIVLLALVALPLALAWPWLHAPLMGNDIEWQYLPGHAWLGRAVAGGELPLWCPEAGGGFPLWAEGQIGPLYPGNLLRVTALPPWRAFALTLLLHLVWAGLGGYRHLRLLGCRRLAALAGALAWVGSGPLVARAVHANLFEGLCWLPWLCVGLEASLTGRRGRGWAGLSIGMMLLAGHQHPVLLASLLAPIYLLGRQAGGDTQARRRDLPGLLLGPFAWGALLGAAAWLPLAELVPHGERAGGLKLAERTFCSLEPAGLYSLVAPQWYGSPFAADQGSLRNLGLVLPYEWCAYVGLLPLLALTRLKLVERRRRWLVGIVALVGLALAMGHVLPLYAGLTMLPGWSMVRVPGRLLPLWAYGMALLMGLCLQAHAQVGSPTGRDRLRWVLRLVLLGAALAGLSWLLGQASGGRGEPWWRAAAVAGGALLLWLLPVRAGRGRWWLAAAALIVAVDGGSAFWGYYAVADADYYDPPPGAAAQAMTPTRVLAPEYCGALGANRHLLVPGLANAGLRSILALNRQRDVVELAQRGLTAGDPVGRQWLSLLRVEAGQVQTTPERATPRLKLRPSSVGPAPDAWLVARAEQVASAAASLSAVKQPNWRPDEVAYVEGRPAADLAAGGLDIRGLLLRHTRQRLSMAADVPAARLLVVSQTAYPGWRLYWQGRWRSARVVDHALLGAEVKPGRGCLRLVFEPVSVRLGLFLSLLGLAGLVGRAVLRGGRR